MLLTLVNISYFYYQHKHLFLSLARKGLSQFWHFIFYLSWCETEDRCIPAGECRTGGLDMVAQAGNLC